MVDHRIAHAPPAIIELIIFGASMAIIIHTDTKIALLSEEFKVFGRFIMRHSLHISLVLCAWLLGCFYAYSLDK